MGEGPDPRAVALDILAASSRGRRLDLAFRTATTQLDPRRRAWVRELTFGVARLRGRLDFALARLVHRGIDRLDPAVLDVLRAGAYQILYMDTVPAYAAVSSAVASARERTSRGAAGLVNAVLRTLAREGLDQASFPDPEHDPAGHFAHWHSHPRWLIDRWLTRWGRDEVARLVRYDNTVPSLHVRPVGPGLAEAGERLAARGIEVQDAGRGSRCLRVLGPADPREILRTVPGVIQDPGSSLVVEYVEAPPGAFVADLCAAPGGKALALSGSAAYVLAADPSLARARLVQASARRLGAGVGVVVAAGERPALREADIVLLDVPCSGTGTLARHPDARWRLTEGDVGELARVQGGILEGAAPLVPEGGLLVYSTCTLEPEENELQVEGFLAEHPEFVPEAPRGVAPELLDERGFLRVLPQETGFDGAFGARMRRIRVV